MRNKSVLIFGGSGFLGAHLAEQLLKDGYTVSIFCRTPEEARMLECFQGADFIEGDLLDKEAVARAVTGKAVIINLATIVQTGASFEPYSDLGVNVVGQLNILEARKSNNITARYLYAGSSMQFGRVAPEHLPVGEDAPQVPISLYGIHKATAEAYTRLYERAHDVRSIILRFPPLYGASIHNKKSRSFLDLFIRKALRDEQFLVNGFGQDLKDFLYLDDAVAAIQAVLESEITGGSYNVGSGSPTLFKDVAQIIVEECGMGTYELVPFPEELERFELGSFYFDISKLRDELGWSPRIDIREGIKRMVAFYRKNNETI